MDEDKKGLELEYVSIREEAISTIATKDQLISSMYTLCVTILGLASVLQMEQVIGLIYIVLIPFQAFINTRLLHIARCGAYINFYIEPALGNMHWEEIIHKADAEFSKRYRINLGKFQVTRSLGKYGASIFSIVALLLFFFHNLMICNHKILFDLDAVYLLILYFMLTIFVIYLNRKGTNFEKIYELYKDILKDINS